MIEFININYTNKRRKTVNVLTRIENWKQRVGNSIGVDRGMANAICLAIRTTFDQYASIWNDAFYHCQVNSGWKEASLIRRACVLASVTPVFSSSSPIARTHARPISFRHRSLCKCANLPPVCVNQYVFVKSQRRLRYEETVSKDREIRENKRNFPDENPLIIVCTSLR